MSKSAPPTKGSKSNLDKFKDDLHAPIGKGRTLYGAAVADYEAEGLNVLLRERGMDIASYRSKLPSFSSSYQAWYSEAIAVIRQLLPDRLVDFEQHYKKSKSRKDLSYESYRIEDALQGLMVTNAFNDKKVGPDAALPHIYQQVSILEAAERRFESTLFDIRQIVQADLFDSELDAARELLGNGFDRAAGAVAGVVLEKHLAQVAQNHRVTTRKVHPTISDLNDMLKKAGVLDVPGWRQIQRLGDLRNLCDHKKHRDPTSDEVDELISGVEKLTKTLF